MAKKSKIPTKDQIINALDDFANGKELKDIYIMLGVKRTHFQKLIAKYELSGQYACARTIYCDSLIEEINDVIADLKKAKIDPSSARVIIDANKWKLSKFYPKMFGDKLDLTTDGEKINPIFQVMDKKTADELSDLKK